MEKQLSESKFSTLAKKKNMKSRYRPTINLKECRYTVVEKVATKILLWNKIGSTYKK